MNWVLMLINWNAVSAISNILVAIGTFTAVVVSLRIAKRQNKEKLKIIGNFIAGDHSDTFGHINTIKVQNIGNGKVYIEELSFASPKRIKSLKETYRPSIKDPSAIFYFLKALFTKPTLQYLPNEYTKSDDYYHLEKSPKIPIALESNHSMEFRIPDFYFQETFFNDEFKEDEKLNIYVIILTGTGKYFRGKLLIHNDELLEKNDVGEGN
ncbi:hypothetical protein M4D71_00635 [Niallia taxi]|uniref:hypothetical protein n=1 Tax=Niallia taxi TaxID=2499688 RepID=UPI0021A3919B|nr:hypothetical protein [Niallia taxi]MCT2342625.1 hypothetical protein [Niallia taxi]